MNHINTMQGLLKYKHNRILVVDDDEMCLVSMKFLLQNLGFDTDK